MKKYILFFLFILLLINTYAQNKQDSLFLENDSLNIQNMSTLFNIEQKSYKKPEIIPPSPQSQQIEKYINNDVSGYNGIPAINIPLYEIKIKGLSIPISISYNASGIKYGQNDGILGVGWTFDSGNYRVFRSIYGGADEQYPFFDKEEFNRNLSSSHNYEGGCYFLTFAPNTEYYKILQSNKYPRHDGEYDQFSYNLPSTSGHFIIKDRNNLDISIIEDNTDKIQLDNNYYQGRIRSISDITITDKNGFVYLLGGKKIDTDDYLCEFISSDNALYTNGWALKRINSPLNESISFDYLFYNVTPASMLIGEIEGYSVSDAEIYRYSGHPSYNGYTSKTDLIHSSDITQRGFIVSKIVSEKEIVNFIYSSTQNPILERIDIKSLNGTLIKQILFNYDDVNRNKWHRMLKSIEIKNGNTKLNKYTFDYYLPPVDIDNIKKMIPDQWGYYSKTKKNMVNNYDNSLVLHQELKNEKYLKRAYPRIIENIGEILPEYIFHDRSVNYGAHNYFSLKKVTYPTGGYTEYEYESNRYKNNNNDIKIGGGQRIKRIINMTHSLGTPLINEYKYGVGESGIGVANFPELNENHFIDEKLLFSLNNNEGAMDLSFEVSTRDYYMSPVISEMTDFKVSYNEIAIYQYNENRAYNGKTINYYEIPNQYIKHGLYILSHILSDFNNAICNYHNMESVLEYRPGYKPYLKKMRIYDNQQKLQKEEILNYYTPETNTYEGVKVKQKFYFDKYYTFDINNNNLDPFNYVSQFCNYNFYRIITGSNGMLSSKETIEYSNEGNFRVKEEYNYNSKNLISSRTKRNSSINGNENYINIYKYPMDYNDIIYSDMISKNMIDYIIEEKQSYNNNIVNKVKTNYDKVNDLILPASIETSNSGLNTSRTDIIFDKYDTRGNIIQYTNLEGLSTVILWSYNRQYPIAEIKNATHNKITDILGQSFIERVAESLSPSNADIEKINNLRLNTQLENSFINTYTFELGIGMMSATNASNITTHYQYDVFGRLTEIYIIENNIKKVIESYDYQYQNF